MSRYSVKQVSDLTGVPSATLRAWERRYAVVEPERTESRYRRYDDADVARLQEMARLVAEGAPASLAAAEVAAGMGRGRSAAAGADTTAAHRDTGAWPEEPATRPGAPTTADLVRAARTFDQDLLDRVLDAAFALGTFEHVVDGWLMPSLEALGRAWSTGSVSVAGEHFVSATVLSRLSQSFAAAGVHRGAPLVVVGLPAGSRHELGVVGFATCLRRQGVDVRYLGADVPRESWREAVGTMTPAAVVLSVPMRSDVSEATDLLAELREVDGDLGLFLGGGAAGSVHLPPGATMLPGRLSTAAEQVALSVHP